MFLHRFNQPKVQCLGGSIGYSRVQALHSRLASCEYVRLEFWIFVYLPFGHEIFFQRLLFTTLVDFGVLFSINFLSSPAFLGLRKALEQDAMFSSVSTWL